MTTKALAAVLLRSHRRLALVPLAVLVLVLAAVLVLASDAVLLVATWCGQNYG